MLIGTTAWSRLGSAESGPAADVPGALFDLCRSRSPKAVKTAETSLYCLLSNQGTAGQASPPAVEVLVTALREGWCVDRERVYYVVEEIGRTGAVQQDDFREEVLNGIRSALSAGLDIYLADLDAAEDLPSLFELLNLLAPRHPIILDRLRALVERSSGPLRARAEEAYQIGLEHIDLHVEEPGHC
jgi:hypothetical protein